MGHLEVADKQMLEKLLWKVNDGINAYRHP
jgi:hypothetical protein